jgi:hypothetical protein
LHHRSHINIQGQQIPRNLPGIFDPTALRGKTPTWNYVAAARPKYPIWVMRDDSESSFIAFGICYERRGLDQLE